jgi:CheY-like chemotaxis protein
MQANSVLVVDDEADTRETIRWVLESAGFAVCTAEHGQAALEALRSLANLDVNLGLVLLDLSMPVLDGNGMLRALRTDPRVSAIPVTVVTGSDTPRPPLATALLRKPVDPEALIRHVALYCQPCPRRFDQLALCGPAARVAWASPTCLFCRRESVGDASGTGVRNDDGGGLGPTP